MISSAVTQGRDWYLGPGVMGSDKRMRRRDTFLKAVWCISVFERASLPLKVSVAAMVGPKLRIYEMRSMF